MTAGTVTVHLNSNSQLLNRSETQDNPDDSLPKACGVVLVDMGTYRWRDEEAAQAVPQKQQPGSSAVGAKHVRWGPSADGDASDAWQSAPAAEAPAPVQQQAAAPALHLVQAIPRSLTSRLMLLPWPLPACVGEVG
jgi:hypothetical protein